MRIKVSVLAAAIVVVLGADVFVLTQQDKSTAVSLTDAVEDFRSRATTVEPEAAESTEETVATAPAAEASPTATPAHAARGATAAGSTAPAAPSAPAAQGAFVRPSEGVYTYRTRGGEEVSLGGGRHTYPERTYASVSHRGGCEYLFEHRVLEEHVEKSIDCSRAGQHLHLQNESTITFFGQPNSATHRCEPPMLVVAVSDTPGTTRTHTCRADDGSTAEITTTFVGRERITVGGTAIESYRLKGDSVISGRATGSSTSETWLHPDTGLMLKHIRKVNTRAAAFGTTVDYREDVVHELERLQPSH